ncbi:MAG: DsbA family protein [Pseudomonadota bacterium]
MTTPVTTRRALLAAATALPVFALPKLPALAQEAAEGLPERALDDLVMGDENAPVTVIEYAAFTCGHCEAFHRDTFPTIKAEYIDTGKVKFVIREVYFQRYGLWASMVARCGGADAFHPVAEQLFKTRETWLRAEDVGAAIQRVGKLNGLSSKALNACLSDEGYARTLVERYQAGAEEHGVNSTPTFVVNGEVHRGNMPIADFREILDEALSA